MTKALPVFPKLKWVGFDVDGVMTDGGIYLDDNGRQSKRFHSRDGHGLKMLLRSSLRVCVITGRQSGVMEHRAKEMGIVEMHQDVKDKLAVYEQILKKDALLPEETAFAGDDLVDLPILLRCGLAMAPADACPEVLENVHFVSRSPAGHGAVREMVEFMLKNMGLWDELTAQYLR
ncbi:MAG: HAD hydrolase family protein [Deltaproteobacteria bacterium]|jgi:3-deoxy-D-manno-octulosonate 8-phosphate phosphatase (KDO 8-P phosphatase)|nr:HAD hydrolase family protein [Deltaproteobacteria bacterium]